MEPPGEVLQPERWLHVVDARHCSETLVEAHQRLDLVPHAGLVPDGVEALEAADLGGAALQTCCRYRGQKRKQQHHTRQDYASGRHVATIVATRLQLVKVPGVCGAITQLAPRPTIAVGAVAVAVGTSMATSVTGRPVTIRLAAVRPRCQSRVAPVAGCQVERRHRGVHSTADSMDGTAQSALGSLGIGARPEVVCGTDITPCGATQRMPTNRTIAT
eukprot:7384803-Prymnesium_polylepis.1